MLLVSFSKQISGLTSSRTRPLTLVRWWGVYILYGRVLASRRDVVVTHRLLLRRRESVVATEEATGTAAAAAEGGTEGE